MTRKFIKLPIKDLDRCDEVEAENLSENTFREEDLEDNETNQNENN